MNISPFNFTIIMGKHNEFGKKGEALAADLLRKKGYTIAHQNYRYLKAEVDIIAQKAGILAIVEVKSRSSEHLQEILETITPKKIQLLVAAADRYVMERDLEVEVRFDIITVLKKGKEYQLEHIPDAFYHF